MLKIKAEKKLHIVGKSADLLYTKKKKPGV